MLVVCLTVGLVLLFIGVGVWLRTGLPSMQILSSDVGAALPARKPLVSHRYGLTGQPDYLVQIDRGIVPVELKSGNIPRNRRPHAGNLMQLAAYCLLVEDTMAVSVPYGIINYRDGSIRIRFTDTLRDRLLDILPRIQAAKSKPANCHRSHRHAGRCRTCGYRPVCSEALQ
jgi:CRISPR-associated exonuclease Cas4